MNAQPWSDLWVAHNIDTEDLWFDGAWYIRHNAGYYQELKNDAILHLISSRLPLGTAKQLKSVQSLSRLRAVERLLRPLCQHDYVSTRGYLATPDGIIDLSTGNIINDSNIRIKCKTEARVADNYVAWNEEMLHWHNYSQDIVDWLQIVYGAAICGAGERCMVIHYGPTSTGKSLHIEVIASALGDELSSAIGWQSLCGKDTGGMAPELFAARHARVVSLSESDLGYWLSAAAIKRIVGQDRITIRGLYRDPITFTPEWMIFASTNSLPRISQYDSAVQRRIRLVPWNVQHKDDSKARDRIMNMAPEALAWMIAGAKKYLELGYIPESPCSQDSLEELSPIHGWLETLTSYSNSSLSTLWMHYKSYSEATGDGVIRSSRELAKHLTDAGWKQLHTREGNLWIKPQERSND